MRSENEVGSFWRTKQEKQIRETLRENVPSADTDTVFVFIFIFIFTFSLPDFITSGEGRTCR